MCMPNMSSVTFVVFKLKMVLHFFTLALLGPRAPCPWDFSWQKHSLETQSYLYAKYELCSFCTFHARGGFAFLHFGP